MAAELGLIHGDALDASGRLERLNLHNAVHQQEGRTMGQDFHDFIDIEFHKHIPLSILSLAALPQEVLLKPYSGHGLKLPQ